MFNKEMISFFLIFYCCSTFGHSIINTTQLMNSLLTNYDKDFSPSFGGGSPVNVGVTLYVLNIGSISSDTMDFSVDMFFRQFWIDARLKNVIHSDINIESFSIPAHKIWNPDTFFPNEKKARFHEVTSPNILTRVSITGNVLVSVRVSLKLSCAMNLRLFPFDNQVCTLELESYGHKMDDVIYSWQKEANSVGISPDACSETEFKFIGHKLRSMNIALSTGNYSRLAVDFAFSRNASPYILKIYFPATLIVILSWLGFWIKPTCKTARMCLGIICVLIVFEIFEEVYEDIPKTCYTKVIDVYLIICLLMVALTLVEFVVVFSNHVDYESGKDNEMESKSSYLRKFQEITCVFDKFSRIAFPMIFAIFSLIYWIVVVKMSDNELDETKFTRFF